MNDKLRAIHKIRVEFVKLENSIVHEDTASKSPLTSSSDLHSSIFPFVSDNIIYCPHWETLFPELRQRYEEYCLTRNMEVLGAKTFAYEIRVCLTYLYAHKGLMFTPRNSHMKWKNIRIIFN